MKAATLISISTALTAAELPLQELQEKAGHGDAVAQVALAILYRDGKGVAKDDALAMQWAHRAADAGNADAMDFVEIGRAHV